MKSVIRPEWNKYLLKDGKDTTLDKALAKIAECVDFLKEHKTRTDLSFLLGHGNAYHLSDE